ARAAEELRGQVGRSFEDQACRRPRRQDIEARESDLDQPWPAVGVEADLSRLEAPNDPPAVVDRLEEIRDPTQEREACVEVRGRTPRDPGAKARRVGAIGGDLEGPTAEPPRRRALVRPDRPVGDDLGDALDPRIRHAKQVPTIAFAQRSFVVELVEELSEAKLST